MVASVADQRRSLTPGDAAPSLTPRARPNRFQGFGGIYFPAVEQEIPWLGDYTPAHVEPRIKKIMRRSAMIRLAERLLRSPFRGITYRIDETTGDPMTRAFVRAAYLSRPVFQRATRRFLTAVPMGYQALEMRWSLEDVLVDVDGLGGVPPQTLGGRYVIRDLVDLDPERVLLCRDPWGDPDRLEFDGVFLEERDVVVVSFEAEHQDWYGRGLCDSAYEPWFESQHVKRLHKRWAEHKSDPARIGYAPDDGLAQAADEALDGQGATPAAVLAKAMMSLRSGGACSLPGEVDERGTRLWEIRELSTQNQTADFLEHRRYLDDMELRGMGIPERTLTQEGVGSYSMADVHVSVLMTMLEDVREDVVLASHDRVAERLVRVNFGRHAAVPRFASSELNRQSRAVLVDLIKATLNTPRKTPDGRTYTIAETIDGIGGLEALNVPHHRPRNVATAAPTAPATAPAAVAQPAAETVDVQATAFNGAQILALKDLIVSVTAGELPAETAIEAIVAGFPSISRGQAQAMVGPAAARAVEGAAIDAELEEEPTAEELARFAESAADVGARYKVGAATVRGWGRVAPDDVVLSLPGGRYRFNGSRLDAWIAAGPNRANTLDAGAAAPDGGAA